MVKPPGRGSGSGRPVAPNPIIRPQMKPIEMFPVLADDLTEVDRVIRARLGSEVALINTVGEYIISAGGKRMRPVLLLLMARALNYAGGQHHLCLLYTSPSPRD